MARAGAVPIEETLPGTVRARNQVAVRPEIEARVVEVLARDGDAVERGAPLVRLDDREARERLRQAEAEVRLAEATAAAARARGAELAARARRSRTLAAEGLLSEQELETIEAELVAAEASGDEAEARVELARAAAAERRSALEKTIVRSPVAGLVGDRRAEVGLVADPSEPLFLVGDPGRLIVEIELTEAQLRDVRAGQTALVVPRGAGADGAIRAELARISPFLAAASFTALGEIELDNPAGAAAGARPLRPGALVDVRLQVGESGRATLVPVAALWEDPASGATGVYVVAEAAGLVEPAAGGERAEVAEPDPRERPVELVRVELVAEGGGVAGVAPAGGGARLEPGAWVVTIGQHLLAEPAGVAPAGAAEAAAGAPEAAATRARVRPVTWRRVLALQGRQDEDLLAEFLAKQRAVAGALGAEIPASEDEVDRVLEAERGRAADRGGG